jgi:hypothetical protein
MPGSTSTLQTLSEKLPTTHPALLLGPLAIIAWMMAPGFAPGEVGNTTASGPVQAAWDAARTAMSGGKTAPGDNATYAGGTTAGTNVGGTAQAATVPSQVIVTPGGYPPPSSALGAYPDSSLGGAGNGGGSGGGGGNSGSGAGTGNSGHSNSGQQQPPTQSRAQPQEQAGAHMSPGPAAPSPAPPLNIAPHTYANASGPVMTPAPEPQRMAPPVVVVPPLFHPFAPFFRPFIPMQRLAYGRPVMVRNVVSSGGGRRR